MTMLRLVGLMRDCVLVFDGVSHVAAVVTHADNVKGSIKNARNSSSEVLVRKRKKKGLTKKNLRKLRDHDGIVHVVRMKPQSVVIPFRFVASRGASSERIDDYLVPVKKHFPRGSSLCGELSLRGVWVDQDTASTCIGCVVHFIG